MVEIGAGGPGLNRLQDLRGQRKTLDNEISMLEDMLMERIVMSTALANA